MNSFHALSVLGIGLASFLSTNVDDLLLLILFFSDGQTPRTRIIAGQFLGIGAIVSISLGTGIAGRYLIPQSWLGGLGVVPLLLGLSKLVNLVRRSKTMEGMTPSPPKAMSTLAVTLVILSSGGDNIPVYASLFANEAWADTLALVLIYGILTGSLCVAASLIASSALLRKHLIQGSQPLIALLLIGLGIFILAQAFLRIP